MARNRLLKLAQKYGTDKAQHGYIPYYELLLNEPNSMLEIGCFKGASLRMWHEYFPKCELHTLDLFIEYIEPTDIKGLICHKGSQSDITLLESLPNFDLIIDDGSHNAIDIQTSFEHLFSKLNEGGIYVIEDLHCQEIQSYRYMGEVGGYPYYMPFEETILGKMLSNTFQHRFELFENKIAFIYA